MSEHVLIHRQRTLLWELTKLVGERAKTEPVIEASFKVRNDAADRDHDEDYQAVISRFAQEKESTDKEYTDSRLRVTQRYEREQADAEKEYQDTRRASSARFLQ